MAKLTSIIAFVWCCLFLGAIAQAELANDTRTNTRTIATYRNQHIGALAFSPNGRVIAIGLRGSPYPDDKKVGVVELREVATGRLIHSLKATFGELNALAFSPNGRWVAATVGTGGWRVRSEADPPYPEILGEAYIWDAKTGKLKDKMTLPSGQALSIAFSPNSRSAVIGSGDTTLRLWDFSIGKSKWVVRGQARHVTAVEFFPNGKTILSANWDESVRTWDAATGKLKHVFNAKDNHGAILAVAISPQGIIASAGNDRLRLWNSQGKMLRTPGERKIISALRFSPDGTKLAARVNWEGVTVWEIGKDKDRIMKTLETRGESALAFTPDGKYLAVSNTDDSGSTIALYKL